MIAKKKAKVHWLREGDPNTKYFFNSIKGWCNINSIQSVMLEDGSYSCGMVRVKEEFINHFRDVLNGNSNGKVKIEELGKLVLFQVSHKEALAFAKDVKDEEIKNIIFSIGLI